MLGIKIKKLKFQKLAIFFFQMSWFQSWKKKKTKTKDGLNDKVPRHSISKSIDGINVCKELIAI